MDIEVLRERWSTVLRLTKREVEILGYIVDGQTSKEVAQILGISPSTVEVHREHIRLKLGARNTADLLRIALVGKS